MILSFARPPRRLPDWEERFVENIARLQQMAPAWGKLDCITLCRDHVSAITGADPQTWPGGWTTEVGAARVLKRCGFADVGAAMAAALEEIPPVAAYVGDVGVIFSEAGPAACIVLGEQLATLRPSGLDLRTSRSALVRAFRV